jgi:hypothetical protein
MPNCVIRRRSLACVALLAQLCWACTNAEPVAPVPQLLTDFDPARSAFRSGSTPFHVS